MEQFNQINLILNNVDFILLIFFFPLKLQMLHFLKKQIKKQYAKKHPFEFGLNINLRT